MVRNTAVRLAAIAILAACGTAGAGDTPDPRPPLTPELPADDPGAAAAYAAARRTPIDPAVDPVEARLSAIEHTGRMPVTSLRFGGRLPDPGAVPAGALKLAITLHQLGRWTPLGPGNIGGRSRTLVVHPDDPDTMFLGGVSGGVWKTVDGGGSWRPLTDRLSNIAVNSMAMNPADPDEIYVGTGEGYFREEVRGTWLPLRGAGIFKTGDGGATWRRLETTTGPDFHWVNDLVVSPNHPQRMYAATRSGVWVSEDGGDTWQRSLETDVTGGCLDLLVRGDHPADWVYASCGTLDQATVYRRIMRADGVWEPVLSEPGMGRTTLALAPSDPRIVYALAASDRPGPGGRFEQGLHAVFRSSEDGDAGSWEARVRNDDPDRLATLILTNPAAASYADCGWYDQNVYVNMGWYTNVIAVDPVDPDVIWAAGVDLFRSDDGGRSWGLASYWWLDPTYSTFVHADQHAIVFHPSYDGADNRQMLVANDGGVFRTSDARAPVGRGAGAICDPEASQVSWTRLNHDLGITQFYHGAAFPDGSRYIGGAQDNGTLLGDDVLGANRWQHVWGGDGGYVAVDPSDPSRVYAESQRLGFVRSTDGGLTYEDATRGVTDSSGQFLFVTPFTLDELRPQRLWTGGRRLWRTDDRADNWTPASTFLSGGAMVSSVAVSPHDSDVVVAGTTVGDILVTDRAGSAGSQTAWPAVRPRDGFVSSVAFDPVDPTVLWATYAGFGGSHVWRSTDGGATWHPLDGAGASSVPDVPVHAVAVDPTDPARVILGTDVGVMVSTDAGGSWGFENTGFATAVTEALDIVVPDDGPPVLFAFTHGRGAWKVPIAPSVDGPRRPRSRVGG